MSEKFSTRMGDGERVWMDSTKIREDIKDGTVDAAKKAGIPELTAGEQDYMFEIITLHIYPCFNVKTVAWEALT